MNYVFSILLILGTSVTFTYYLLNNPNFLPINNLGEYNWINIFTLLFLISLVLFSFLNILIYLILTFIQKGKESKIKSKGKKEKRREGDDEGVDEIRQSSEVLQNPNRRGRIIASLKFSSILTIGILTVFVLNFFHILNWIWGLSILLVVLIFTFII